MNRQGRTSVFRRLTVLFFLLEAIILVGVSLHLFRYARIQEKAEQRTREETVRQSLTQMEEQIQAAYGLADSLSNDTRLSQIAYHMYPDQYQKSRLILGVLDSIRSSCELNASVEDIVVTFPAEGLRPSNSEGYDSEAIYSFADETPLDEFLLLDQGKVKIRVDHPLISRVFGNFPDYQCEVFVSESFFRSMLTLFGDTDTQGAILLLRDQKGGSASIRLNDQRQDEELILEQVERESGEYHDGTVRGNRHTYAVSLDSSAQVPVTLISWRSVDTISTSMIQTLLSIGAVVLVSSVLFLLLIWQTNRRVARPLRRLMRAFDAVKEGDLETRVHHDRNDEFTELYDSFNRMTAQTEQMVSDIKEQHGLLQNAELMQLQAQIDPHFLYNSFNSIKYMASCEDYEQISAFVSALAQYYRFINKETRQAIPLSAEVQHMETYLYIQQMRFEERIHVEVSGLPQEAENILVPKLILQPLVENCYNYGIKNKLADGLIRIRFVLGGDQLSISVADNGEEMDEARLEELKKQVQSTDDASISHALANIRRRLELAYGEPDLLSLSLSDLGGLEVTLRFDITKNPSNLT